MIGGGILFAATLLGAIYFDPRVMLAGAAALIGGIVMWGSNVGTAREAAASLAAVEAQRAALIGQLDLHPVATRPMLH